MKIAHLNNMANVAWNLAQAQRKVGHEAAVFAVYDHPSLFPHDVTVPHAKGPVFWNVAMFRRLPNFLKFDVLHVHGGIRLTQLFYPFLKRTFPSKVLVVHFHGMEARTGLGLHHLLFADHLFHSTPDLTPLLPESEWLPNPVVLPETFPEADNRVPRFGHFPFRWRPGASEEVGQKGTDEIIRSFRETFGPLDEQRQAGIVSFRGKEAELVVVAGLRHEDAIRAMETCDVVIDQVSDLGIYGMAALEALARGKPVLSTYRPEWFPGSPVVRLGENPGRQFREIAADAGLRQNLGRKGREFVASVHDPIKVAKRTLAVYYGAREEQLADHRQTVSYWVRRGSSYHREFDSLRKEALYHAQAKELLQQLDLLRFETGLDVGCGFGRITRLVRDRGRWTASDVSRDQLIETKAFAPVVVASASALPFRDRRFDLVLASEVLMHIPPPAILGLLRELQRVSRAYIVHMDWFEDYAIGQPSAYTWIHDYPRLWELLGLQVTRKQLEAYPLQSVFIVRVPVMS